MLGLLEAFRASDVRLAIALDEYGNVKGLISLNDILEDLVAIIPGGGGEADAAIVQREDGSWLVDGTVPVEELRAAIGLDAPPPSRRTGYRTLGGLVMAELGRLPRVGDRFDVGGFGLEVVDMDGRRIDRVLIGPRRPLPPRQGSA